MAPVSDDLPLRGARVVFLLPSFGLGGAERQGFLLAKHLRGVQQADVHMVSLSRTAALTSAFDAAALTWSYFDLQHAYRSRPGHARDIVRFAQFLRRHRAEILLPYCMFQNILAALTWRIGGVRACIWNQRDEGRSRLESWVERIAVSQTRWFVSNSQHGADFLIKQLRAPAARVSVIPNGIEMPRAGSTVAGWRDRLGIPRDAFAATMVANLHGKKDHATLVAAWRHVVDRYQGWCTPPHLLLAGAFGDQYIPLFEQVRACSLEHCVHFLGEVPEIDALLQDVDLAVFSSFNEGLPNAVLEAMAHGLAVVATDYCGIREALGPDGAWLLAVPRDPDSLATKILLAAEDPERRRLMGARGRQRVLELFSVERMAAQMTQLVAAEWSGGTPRRRSAPGSLRLRSRTQ